jgi:hypothetical protein
MRESPVKGGVSEEVMKGYKRSSAERRGVKRYIAATTESAVSEGESVSPRTGNRSNETEDVIQTFVMLIREFKDDTFVRWSYV